MERKYYIEVTHVLTQAASLCVCVSFIIYSICMWMDSDVICSMNI
jgi:hypothetical protein